MWGVCLFHPTNENWTGFPDASFMPVFNQHNNFFPESSVYWQYFLSVLPFENLPKQNKKTPTNCGRNIAPWCLPLVALLYAVPQFSLSFCFLPEHLLFFYIVYEQIGFRTNKVFAPTCVFCYGVYFKGSFKFILQKGLKGLELIKYHKSWCSFLQWKIRLFIFGGFTCHQQLVNSLMLVTLFRMEWITILLQRMQWGRGVNKFRKENLSPVL